MNCKYTKTKVLAGDLSRGWHMVKKQVIWAEIRWERVEKENENKLTAKLNFLNTSVNYDYCYLKAGTRRECKTKNVED